MTGLFRVIGGSAPPSSASGARARCVTSVTEGRTSPSDYFISRLASARPSSPRISFGGR